MTKIARISITLPQDVLTAADRRARELDRSRSWLVAEALRTFVSRAVHEPEGPVYAREAVADARRRHIAADLQLSPEERLRRAEELAHLGKLARHGRTGRRRQIIGFDTYEDYYEWKRARLAGE
jgi:predicted transcriptional regulator